MYKEFFGLQKAPFDLTPDPEFLYLSEQHRNGLAVLTYVILARKGFVVLTGNAGTGKTTLLTRILEYLDESDVLSSFIVHPTLTPSEFLETMLLDFGLPDISPSKAQRIATLRTFLWSRQQEGKTTALIVDEAHKLSLEVLEEIRLLGNLESAKEKLLQIVLVGQSELDDVLNRENLRQLKQRISLRLAIKPLSGTDIERYIQHRWRKAGGTEAPFTAGALTTVAQASQGIPRVINLLCDNALMQAFAEESASVEPYHVADVCREMQFSAPLPKAAAMVEPPAPAPAPATEILPVEPFEMKTLQRYATKATKRPLLGKLFGIFGIKVRHRQRIETA